MATRGSVTEAHRLREAGNQLFRSSSVKGFAPCIQESRLDEAIRFYRSSLNESRNDDERASAHKNLSKAFKKRLELLFAPSKGPLRKDLLQYLLQQGVDHAVRALATGRASKHADWLADVKETLKQTVDLTYSELLQRFDVLHRLPFSAVVCGILERDVPATSFAALPAFISDARNLFSACVSVMDADRDLCGPMNFYANLLEWAKRRVCQAEVAWTSLARDDEDPEFDLMEIKQLGEQIRTQSALLEILRHRIAGDRAFARAVLDDERISMDEVYVALDEYKYSEVLARTVDLECEAIAVQRQGIIISDVLCFPERAQYYFLHAVQLAHSTDTASSHFHSRPWYAKCVAAIEKHRLKKLAEEDQARAESEEGIRAQLATELEALLDKSNESCVKFLTFIYSTHPPKGQDMVIGPTDPDSLKKSIMRAVQHYHPDKNLAKKHGKPWAFLCSEITKYLNRFYECFK